MILKNFLFLKMIIIIHQIKLVLSIEIECNEYKDCFNCSICAKEENMTCKCEWDPILKQCTNSSFLIKNSDWKNYYKNCIDDLSKLIDLNEAEQTSIKSYNQGQALFVCGSRRMQISVICTQEELDSFGSGGGL